MCHIPCVISALTITVLEYELIQSGYVTDNAINTLRELSEAIKALKSEYNQQ